MHRSRIGRQSTGLRNSRWSTTHHPAGFGASAGCAVRRTAGNFPCVHRPCRSRHFRAGTRTAGSDADPATGDAVRHRPGRSHADGVDFGRQLVRNTTAHRTRWPAIGRLACIRAVDGIAAIASLPFCQPRISRRIRHRAPGPGTGRSAQARNRRTGDCRGAVALL